MLCPATHSGQGPRPFTSTVYQVQAPHCACLHTEVQAILPDIYDGASITLFLCCADGVQTLASRWPIGIALHQAAWTCGPANRLGGLIIFFPAIRGPVFNLWPASQPMDDGDNGDAPAIATSGWSFIGFNAPHIGPAMPLLFCQLYCFRAQRASIAFAHSSLPHVLPSWSR